MQEKQKIKELKKKNKELIKKVASLKKKQDKGEGSEEDLDARLRKIVAIASGKQGSGSVCRIFYTSNAFK